MDEALGLGGLVWGSGVEGFQPAEDGFNLQL